MKWRPLNEQERREPLPPPATFEPVVMPHLDSAYNLARWLPRDATATEDVVQDSVLGALSYFESYKGGDARAWFLRIVRNAAYVVLTARQRGRTTGLCGRTTAISIMPQRPVAATDMTSSTGARMA